MQSVLGMCAIYAKCPCYVVLYMQRLRILPEPHTIAPRVCSAKLENAKPAREHVRPRHEPTQQSKTLVASANWLELNRGVVPQVRTTKHSPANPALVC